MIEHKGKVGDNLYSIKLPDDSSIPFRLLTYGEFCSCRTSLELGEIPSVQIYEWIFRRCVLDSFYQDEDNWDNLRAGVFDTVPKVIYFMSGPSNDKFFKEILEEHRTSAQALEFQMKSTVCRVFPGYTLEGLDQLDFPTVVRAFANAEAVLMREGIIEQPYEIINKEDSPNAGFSVKEAQKEAEIVKKT